MPAAAIRECWKRRRESQMRLTRLAHLPRYVERRLPLRRLNTRYWQADP